MYCRQGKLTLNTNVDVVLLTGLCFSTSVIGLRKGIEGLEILDVCGHKIDGERSAAFGWYRELGSENVWSGVCDVEG